VYCHPLTPTEIRAHLTPRAHAPDFWNFFLFGYAQQRLIRDLRICLFRTVIRQEVGFFDTTSSGDLTSRLQVDTSEMANDLTWVFRFTIEALVRIGGITAYMVSVHPW